MPGIYLVVTKGLLFAVIKNDFLCALRLVIFLIRQRDLEFWLQKDGDIVAYFRPVSGRRTFICLEDRQRI